jgi:hypothetical protein
MMRRIDWLLVPPVRPDDDEGSQIQTTLGRLLERANREGIDADEIEEIGAMSTLYEQHTVSTCEAVGAPVVEDDPDWESRILDEFAETDLDEDLEVYLESRRKHPDCERCPYASPYSLYPMDPCEFGAGALDDLLTDEALREAIQTPSDPAAMVALAARLRDAIDGGRHSTSEVVHVRDYIEKAIFFLRFWSERGFSIFPRCDDASPWDAAEHGCASDDDKPTGLIH